MSASPLFLLAACGDPLTDDHFLGTPLWQLRVETGASESSQLTDASGLRVALFFSPGGTQVTDLERHVEQTSTSRPAALPQGLTLSVFEPPAKELFAAGAAYAVGRVAAYLDKNQDGRRGAGEALVGLWAPGAVLYASRALGAGETPTSGPLDKGFYQLMVQQTCGKMPTAPRTPGTCNVPLGQPCQRDDQCGPGFCLLSNGAPWPSGSCAVTEPPRDGCRPQDASYYPAEGASGPSGFYLRRCARDEDCRRTQDGPAGLYRCDAGLLACVPNLPVHVTVGGAEKPPPLCPG